MFPSEFYVASWAEELECCSYHMVKMFDDIYSHFDTAPLFCGQTDRNDVSGVLHTSTQCKRKNYIHINYNNKV